MKRKRKTPPRGIANIWLVVLGLVLIGFVGLACDTGLVLLTANELQRTADASALAAGLRLHNDQTAARDLAVNIAASNTAAGGDPVLLDLNDSNDPAGDIVLGKYDRKTDTFTPTTADPDAVKVVARRTGGSLSGPLPINFGRIVGVFTVDVSRYAIAMSTGRTGAGLLVLCEDCECALQFGGNNDFILEAGDEYDGTVSINVNSADECSTCGGGTSAYISTDEINMVGDACWNGQPTIDAELNPDSFPIPDPLVPLPDPPVGLDRGEISGSGNFQPGYYSGGLRLSSSSDTVVLDPGVYILDGEGLHITGGNIIAEGVMFYVVGDGDVRLSGNGMTRITPPESGVYEGVSIFQARDNTNTATIVGGSNMDLQGTYYFPSATLNLGGGGTSLGNQMIAYKMEINGNGIFNVQYNGANPDPGNRVFLVE